MNTTSRISEDSGIEARLAARLAGTLTQATHNLPHDVNERLRVARQQALARAREVRLAVPAAATVSGVSAFRGSGRAGSGRLRSCPWCCCWLA